jgi:hypothetical protein
MEVHEEDEEDAASKLGEPVGGSVGISRLLESAYFAACILGIFGAFWAFLNISVNFDDFLGRIFPFFAFFGVRETVYSHGRCHPV